MMIQLNPPIPVTTPKGRALAHFVIDDGIEHDLKWVCFQDINGECWIWKNQDIRAQRNITHGREYISPYYEPSDVSFKKDRDDEYESMRESLNILKQTNIDLFLKLQQTKHKLRKEK